MAKNIVCYSLGAIAPKKRLRFHQELYGYTDRSNHGKYVYQRKGILTSAAYEKPLDSTLILPAKIVPVVAAHLRKYRAKFVSYLIKS